MTATFKVTGDLNDVLGAAPAKMTAFVAASVPAIVSSSTGNPVFTKNAVFRVTGGIVNIDLPAWDPTNLPYSSSGAQFGYTLFIGTQRWTFLARAAGTALDLSAVTSTLPGPLSPNLVDQASALLIQTQAARDAAQAVGTTNDTIIAGRINAAGSATQVALDAGYARKDNAGASIKAFGAKGDGTTDDTAAIHAARDSGATGVYFPAGTYRVSGLVANVAGQKWSFAPGAILQAVGAIAGPVVKVTAADVRLDGINIDGNRAAQSVSYALYGIHAQGSTRFQVTDAAVTNCSGIGVMIESATDTRIANSRITGNAPDSQNFAQIQSLGTSSSDGIIITGCVIDGSTTHSGGIKIGVGNSGVTHQRVVIANNSITVGDAGATPTLGVEIFANNGGTVRTVAITGNIVRGANATNTTILGISVSGASTAGTGTFGITVTGNVVRDCRIASIELIGHTITATGNTIVNSGNVSLSSISLGDLGKAITFSANTIRDCVSPNYVIRITGGTTSGTNDLTGCVVDGNNISGSLSTAACFYIQSGYVTDLRISNNVCLNLLNVAVLFANGATVTRPIVEGNTLRLATTGVPANVDVINFGGGSVVTDAVVRNNHIANATRDGIYVNVVVAGLRIIGNQVQSCIEGIQIIGVCTNVEVIDNFTSDCTWGILLKGTNVTSSGNRFRNCTNTIYYGYVSTSITPYELSGVTQTTAPVAGAAAALPATPAGYLPVLINGVVQKVPYY